MDAGEWAEVFRAGAGAVSGIGMIREEGLPAELYGAAALSRALAAMAETANRIAARQPPG